MVVDHIPYATVGGAVALGKLAYPVTIAGDQIIPACAHELWLIGEQPHAATGQPLGLATSSIREVAPGLTASYMLSSKPMPQGAYSDQYAKITTYVRILSHEALARDRSHRHHHRNQQRHIPTERDRGRSRGPLDATAASGRSQSRGAPINIRSLTDPDIDTTTHGQSSVWDRRRLRAAARGRPQGQRCGAGTGPGPRAAWVVDPR